MIASFLPDRAAARARLRHLLDRVECTLRDTDDLEAADPALTTRELLLPRDTGEPPSLRARRQAADYLDRRRQRLREDLRSR